MATDATEPMHVTARLIFSTAHVDDSHVSVRFKHGVHTVYLFVDASAPMSEVSKQLVEVLKERYPTGLTSSVDPPRSTSIPSTPILAYGLLNVPNDPTKGWRAVKVGDEDAETPSKCGFRNNSIVAFTFVADHGDEDVLFEVEWPKDDDEFYDQAG
ncbi:hypothetical protein AAL_07376 [Moelleriella libera RCEF 2490]|uniref:Uncharacterized protein n=1 Tax=Moelleriella libera RCEF 2490 TaxID=1081109 RepID=A0A167XN62_9HYPO|nr:hypothetical protein AAL_07376 [Moelleriella libera RCEF 2490]